MPDNDLAQFIQMIAQLSPGPSPNEGFVPPQQGPMDSGRLGMAPESQAFSGMLGQLQGAGVRPPMPNQMGMDSKSAIFELLRAILGQQQLQQQAPAPPPMSDGTVGGSRPLLQKLIGE